MGRRLTQICFSLLLVSVVPTLLSAQGRPQTRDGFWFNAGLGIGTAGCDGCDGRETSASGGLALGGTISPKFLLGGGTNGWSKSEGGATITIATLTAIVRFYPSATGGFFILGGLGLGSVRAELSGFGSETETGSAAIIGLGVTLH